MSYTTNDFEESLSRVGLQTTTIAKVEAAWGKGDGMGQDAGHFKWSDEGASDWCGGFLMRLTDGRYAYLSGWCDYTGWGCQDGAELDMFDSKPALESLVKSEYFSHPSPEEWDLEPYDLNRFLGRAE